MMEENKGKLSPFAPIDDEKQPVKNNQSNSAELETETQPEVFAQGLPAWNLIPKNSVIRRHRS
ncbi:hypothetical protein [Lactiplantibacillus carotarum]|uniref:hypothetical protein n=1 Tax=Lactiplantibacillus carotarum TaxID=2993456 RepID=UPI000E8891E2|nr:hypothetical protein [Lactiplantibacillus carotarum]HAT55903.1 hypothetical protein [Lactobacillus sp.]